MADAPRASASHARIEGRPNMRRKRKYTWMPSLGLVPAGATNYRDVSFDLLLTPELAKSTKPSQASVSLQVGPLVPDVTQQYSTSGADAGTSLRDLAEGQDWLCKRIVGKIPLWANGGTFANANAQWTRCIVTFGIFVARAEDDAPGNVDLDDDEVDPANLDNIRNPWMFRRTWVLLNPGAGENATYKPVVGASGVNNDNQSWSGEAGPHVDIRVARRIRKEERLWYAASIKGADVGVSLVTGTRASQMEVLGKPDFRFLGAMRKGNNKSTF